MSIIVPGKMFAEAYRKRGYAPELGVATLSYLPYCIFNLLSPLMSIFVAAIGWKIRRLHDNNQSNINIKDNENQ